MNLESYPNPNSPPNLWKSLKTCRLRRVNGNHGKCWDSTESCPFYLAFSAPCHVFTVQLAYSSRCVSQPIRKAVAMDSSWRNFQFPTVQKTKFGRISDLLWKTWTQNSTSHTPIPWQTENISVAVRRTILQGILPSKPRVEPEDQMSKIIYWASSLALITSVFMTLIYANCIVLSLYRNDFFPSLDKFQKKCGCQHVSTP